MSSTPTEIKSEALECIKNMDTIHLATYGDGKPHVRPVTLIRFEDKFWIATGAQDAKISQIKQNPNIEFCLLLPKDKTTGYIRCSGTAKIIDDKPTRRRLADGIPFFKEHWQAGPDDPTFALLHIEPKLIEYVRPGEFVAHRIEF